MSIPTNLRTDAKTPPPTGKHSHGLNQVEEQLRLLEARLADVEARLDVIEDWPADEPPPVEPPPVIVPQPSWPTKLQEAIDAAPAGATIDLTGRPEPYRELIVIRKPLTLIEPWITGLYHSTNGAAVGIEVAKTERVTILRPRVQDVRYCGIMVSDSALVTIRGGWVLRIDAARQNAGMNAYGIAVTDRGTRRSSDVTVEDVLVEDVPDWHGLDTHGGIRIRFLDCTVRRANRAVFITASNLGSATDCEVGAGTFLEPTKRSDVPNTKPWNEVGITVVSGCTAYGEGNRFDGWPTGNHIDTQGGPNRFTGTIVTGSV